MGTSFANLHVRTQDIDSVRKAVTEYRSSRKNVVFDSLQGSKIPDGIINLANSLNDRFFIGSFESGWVSILNMFFSYETINDIAIVFSQLIREPILAIGYGDDDMLLASLIEEGKVKTSHVAGNCVENYGYDIQFGDSNLFIVKFNLNCSQENLDEILEIEDLEEKVERLEEALTLPLWVKADYWDEDDDLKEMYEEI